MANKSLSIHAVELAASFPHEADTVFQATSSQRSQTAHFPPKQCLFISTQARWFEDDTQRSIVVGLPTTASCVQRFDDSLNPAIRITYRISLRSSSIREPRYPLLRVVQKFLTLRKSAFRPRQRKKNTRKWYNGLKKGFGYLTPKGCSPK